MGGLPDPGFADRHGVLPAMVDTAVAAAPTTRRR